MRCVWLKHLAHWPVVVGSSPSRSPGAGLFSPKFAHHTTSIPSWQALARDGQDCWLCLNPLRSRWDFRWSLVPIMLQMVPIILFPYSPSSHLLLLKYIPIIPNIYTYYSWQFTYYSGNIYNFVLWRQTQAPKVTQNCYWSKSLYCIIKDASI